MLFTIDPLNHYPDMTHADIIESLGLIPPWVAEAEATGQTIKASLIENYGPFYMGDMTGGTIDGDGVYTYPDDPPLYPLVKAEHNGETFYQYHYGIVAVTTDGGQWVTRMD